MKRGSLYSYPTYSSILYIWKYSCMYTEQRGNVLKNKRVLVLTCTTLYIHINRGSPERKIRYSFYSLRTLVLTCTALYIHINRGSPERKIQYSFYSLRTLQIVQGQNPLLPFRTVYTSRLQVVKRQVLFAVATTELVSKRKLWFYITFLHKTQNNIQYSSLAWP